MCVCGAIKNHAKGMCKPCYRKSDYYKELRKISDKKYQLNNKEIINETRKKRRNSIEFLESDSYAKNLLASTYKIPMSNLSSYSYLVKAKSIELKSRRLLKTIKKNKDDKTE